MEAQADLQLRCVHISCGGYFHVTVRVRNVYLRTNSLDKMFLPKKSSTVFNLITALFAEVFKITRNKYSSRKHTYIILTSLNPFYIVKLGFTGVYIIFLISAQKHRLWVLVRTALARRFFRVPTIYALSRNMKNIRIFHLNLFIFWW